MRRQRFSIDFLEGDTFEGYTQGESWNGFACPYFTFDQAQLLVDSWRKSGSEASYDSGRDEFSFQMQDGETNSFPSMEIEGKKVYPVGSGCWIWTEAEQQVA